MVGVHIFSFSVKKKNFSQPSFNRKIKAAVTYFRQGLKATVVSSGFYSFWLLAVEKMTSSKITWDPANYPALRAGLLQIYFNMGW